MKRILYPLLLVFLTLLISSWGSQGHKKISREAALSFNAEMADFHSWTDFLADHASDADYRKDQDPDEAPKHYIDIDNYYSFLYLGRVPETLDSVIAAYGYSFVYGNGILPYAILATVENLQHSFEIGDFENAKQIAADLGHYVGDAHNPLHITANYDGDLTGNSGIHSRYETSMINAYISSIQYDGDSLNVIADVKRYVFDFVYANHYYADSIMAADNYAKSIAGNTSSSAYKQALWLKTGAFTTELFRKASHSLTELIYTAWKNAGSPSLSAFAIHEPAPKERSISAVVRYDEQIQIKCYSENPGSVTVKILDLNGREIAQLSDGYRESGSFILNWNCSEQPNGLYLVSYSSNSVSFNRKFLLNR